MLFIKPGLFSSLQYAPSHRLAAFGVPLAGPMDQNAAARANALLGQPLDAGVLEFTLLGPVIKFEAPVHFVLSGADLSPHLNGMPLRHEAIIRAGQGDVLSFKQCTGGCRTYMAVNRPLLPDHRLTTRRIKKGDRLVLGPPAPLSAATVVPSSTPLSPVIPWLPGPETPLLQEASYDALFNDAFSVAPSSNRMAYLLQHPPLHAAQKELLSSAVLPGTLQLLPSGQIALLMRDGQTIGGYPRIGIVPEEGINQLAQIKPGEQIRFLRSD